MMRIREFTTVALALGTLALGACDFDIQNPNSPDQIGDNPTQPQVASAVIGLLIAARVDAADWVLDAGIIGREGYRFDGSDPRFTSELLAGPLDPGSGAFGGDHWAEPYAAIRSANNLLAVIGTAATLSAAEQDGVRGFTNTMKALQYLMVLDSHTQDSIVIDVGIDPTAPPAPFSTQAAAYDYIEALLDSAQTQLQSAGGSFPFELTSGWTGFDTPSNFLTFNRGLKARVDVYRQNWAQALTDLAGSFVDTLTTALDVGVYHTYSTGSGDITNPLNQATVENYAHPQLRDSAQIQQDGTSLDQRFLNKTFPRAANTTNSLTSDLGWSRYPGPSSPIPIMRNEELILIRAEANANLGNLGPALDDVNYVRVVSGGLSPLPAFASMAQAIDAILLERRYSLLYEGHRWVDMRRYGRLGVLPLDRPGDVVHPTLPIPTDEVLAHQ